MPRVLVNRGGGTRGVGQARFLNRLESRTGKPLASVFDAVAGTSVGSIGAAVIASGQPMSQYESFFYNWAPKIFTDSLWNDLNRVWDSAKYAPAALEQGLRAVLGDRTLADCQTRFLATAVAIQDGRRRNCYFQSYGSSSEDKDEIVLGPDSKMPLWMVCRASAAAQSYFPGLQWQDIVFWDGGSSGNNAPDMLMLCEAIQELKWPLETLSMLSLGNGNAPWPWKASSAVNPSLKEVMEMTLDMAYHLPEVNAVWQAKTFLGQRHLLMNPDLAVDYGIDLADKATLDIQANEWESLFENSLTSLASIGL